MIFADAVTRQAVVEVSSAVQVPVVHELASEENSSLEFIVVADAVVSSTSIRRRIVVVVETFDIAVDSLSSQLAVDSLPSSMRHR